MKSRVETPTCFQNVPVPEVSKWNLFKVYFIIYSVHRSREDKSEAKFVFNACSLSKEVTKIDHHQNCYYWRIALSFLTKTKAQKVTKYKLSFQFWKKWGENLSPDHSVWLVFNHLRKAQLTDQIALSLNHIMVAKVDVTVFYTLLILYYY